MDGVQIYQCGYEKCKPNKKAEKLICNSNMLHFITEGSGTVNGINASAGQAFLCKSGTYVSWSPCPENPWSYYWINSVGTRSEILLTECGFGETNIINYTQTEELSDLLSLMLKNENSDFLQGIFISIAGLLKSFAPERTLSAPEQHVQRAESIIRQCFGRITVMKLADKLHLSRSYLRNIFSVHRECSPQEYILRCRMSRAAELLRDTDYPISIIGVTVGYDDPFQFSKLFNKRFNMSPSKYRQENYATSLSSDKKEN